MAKPVRLRHPDSGEIKTGFYGFSWTSLLFGGIPALLRGDIAMGVAAIAFGLVLGGLGQPMLSVMAILAWAWIYNKHYTRDLLNRGFEFDDSPEIVAEAKRALGLG
ncbi:MAG: hypothetical protein FJX46_05500 [Alphaproteobacteria bacterium]|nr:hypothetical protein [Alphaproteobacteria bacterium]